MKKLLINFFVLIFISIILLESYSRYYYFSNSNSKIQYQNVNGSLLYKPGSLGIYNKPFNTKYRINSLGFNSVKNNFTSFDEKTNVALVGDSFIVGFHSNVEESIGQRIEKLNSNINVNEYGVEGNIIDYLLIYDKYNLKNYDKVYIFLTGNNDISYKYPNAMNYYKNFLNITKGYLKIERFLYERIISTTYKPNIDLIKKFQNVIYVTHFNFDINFINKQGVNYSNLDVFLNSQNESYNFKFDSHWNNKGRELVADFILDNLKE
jgi:hypothetical protein